MDQYIRDFDDTGIVAVEVSDEDDYLKLIQKNVNDTTFSIFHNNIRSINKNMNELLIMLDKLQYNFDCIILTETWQIPDIHFFKIQGFNIIYNEGDINQNDGVVMYIKDNYNYNIKISKIGAVRVIKATIQIPNETIVIHAMYRPSPTCVHEFNDELQNYLANATNVYGNYNFLVGDLNIDIKSNSDYCQKYLNIMGEAGFKPLIDKYTRIYKDSKSCIDHIFLKCTRYDVCSSYVFKTLITDHFPIVSHLHLKTPQPTGTVTNKISKLNKNKLIEILKNETWNEVYTSDDLDYAVEIFTNKIKNAVDKSTHTTTIKRMQRKRNPWITGGLLKSISVKNELYKKLSKQPNNLTIITEYKKYKNKLTQLIKATKTNYYKEQIERNKNSSKTLWNVVKKFTNKNLVNTEIKEIKVDNELITDKKQIANAFNNYFAKIGEKMASSIDKANIKNDKRNVANNSMFFYPTDINEVSKCINELKDRKSPGLDNLTSEILKTIAEYIKTPLTCIINRILGTGLFPSLFKVAVIKPLYKNDDRKDICNYRPISLISNLAKITEKVIKIRISRYLTKYNLISDKQFGFQSGVSTENAISYLTSNIYKALDSNKQVLCVFMDLAKAFDTVNHSELIQIMEDLGFRGVALKLIKSYLNNRIQYVKLEDNVSYPETVRCGVPQGTVLGPVLFIIYINGLLSLDTIGNISSFADDTVIQYTADSWIQLKTLAEQELVKIKSWFDQKLLSLNFQKTKYIHFSCSVTKSQTSQDLIITSETAEYRIKATKNIKYLGIQIDQHLKWDTHVNSVVKKLRPTLFQFKQLKNILELKYLKILYHSLVESHFCYGIVGWGGILKNYLTNLEILQKYFIKIIFGKDRLYPTELLYKESQLFDIRQLYCYRTLCLQHKTKENLKQIMHNYNTRHKRHIGVQVEKSNKTIGQRSYNYIAPRLYSALPQEIKIIKNNHVFKKQIKKWLQNISRDALHNLIDIKNA